MKFKYFFLLCHPNIFTGLATYIKKFQGYHCSAEENSEHGKSSDRLKSFKNIYAAHFLHIVYLFFSDIT